MSDYRELAATERDLARAAAQRGRQARLESAEAAFYDTAMELTRQAEEEDRAAQSHLEAAGVSTSGLRAEARRLRWQPPR
jgi:hypothetical protein